MESGRRSWLCDRPVRLVAVLAFGGLGLGLPAAPAAQPADAVLVVPFTNLSRQPADAWIGAGIAETVSSDLRTLGAPVVGEDASAREAREARAPGDGELLLAGRRLGAQWLLAGGYQRVGDRLRITARLVHVETGDVRGGTRVDGSLADLFDAQDRIVAALADALVAGGALAGDVAVSGSFPDSPASRVESVPGPVELPNPVPGGSGPGPFGPGTRTHPPPGSA